MFISPWDTFPCRQYSAKAAKLPQQIEEASLVHDITRVVGKDLRVLLPGEATLKPFGHPVFVEAGDNSYFVGDTRSCTKENSQTGAFSITSISEYHIWLHRLVVQKRWQLYSPSDIYNLGAFQVRIYARWIADNIKRRFGIEPNEHMRLMAIAAYFFYCMNDIPNGQSDFYSETDINQIATVIARNTSTDVDTVISIMNEVPIMYSVDDLIRAIQKSSGTMRLDKFNNVMLYSIIGGTWFGTNAREIAAIAVEHPPTFAVLLYNALTNKGYTNSGLAQTVKPYMKHADALSFKANFDLMLMESLETQ